MSNSEDYPYEKPDDCIRPTVSSLTLNTEFFEDQYALNRFMTEVDECFADNDFSDFGGEQTLHILAEVLAAMKVAYGLNPDKTLNDQYQRR